MHCRFSSVIISRYFTELTAVNSRGLGRVGFDKQVGRSSERASERKRGNMRENESDSERTNRLLKHLEASRFKAAYERKSSLE